MPKLKPGERIKGHIPAVDTVQDEAGQLKATEPKLIPWTEAAYLGSGSIAKGEQKKNPKVWASEVVPQAVMERWEDELPAPVRRSSRQRYESLVQKLLAAGRASEAAYGRPVWPESIQLVLDGLGFKRTNTDMHAQVYALAKHYIVKAENQQRAKDARKVVTDWHGHYD